MDILHTAQNNLIDDPRLIHDNSFMMHIYDPLMDELPEFKDYMDLSSIDMDKSGSETNVLCMGGTV